MYSRCETCIHKDKMSFDNPCCDCMVVNSQSNKIYYKNRFLVSRKKEGE